MSMFEAIGALLILGFGGYAALTGAMQIGDLVAFLMLTAFLYDPVSRLQHTRPTPPHRPSHHRGSGLRQLCRPDPHRQPGLGKAHGRRQPDHTGTEHKNVVHKSILD